MDFYSSVCFISGIISIFAGFLVWLADRKSKLNLSWFMMNLAIGLFLVGLGGTIFTDKKMMVVAFGKLLYFGACFSPFFLFYFLSILSERLRAFKNFIYANALIACSFSLLFLFTNLLIEGVEPPRSGIGWTFILSDWYILFPIWSLALFFVSLVALAISFKDPSFDKLKKQQIFFVFWGTLISFGAAYLNFMLDYGVNISPIYNLLIPSHFLFTGYAIVKNRLFDVKFIATELLILGMGLVLVIFPFLMTDLRFQIVSWTIFAIYCVIGYLLIKTSFKELQAKEILETEVEKRTKELQKAYDEMKGQKEEIEKWYSLTVGRELRMAELKKEINNLKKIEDKS
jgi:NADH:ubiquinone oxidoreductase subunit K